MRYAEPKFGEYPILMGIFEPGDTVTIRLVDLATDTELPLTTSGCTESSVDPGYYTWDSQNLITALSGFRQVRYVMTGSGLREHAGKVVIGGYPSDSALRRFEGNIHIDSVNGASGTEYPRGTPTKSDRVSNLTDGRSIADSMGIPSFLLHGAYSTSGNYADWTWNGIEPTDDTITFLAGAVTSGSQFSQVGIGGILDGKITAQECTLVDCTDIEGLLNTCGVNGTLKVKVGGVLQGLTLASQNLTPGSDIDLQGGGGWTIFLGGYMAGNWNLRNVSQAATIIGVSMAGGTITLESTIAAGQIQLYGYGEVTNNATGGTITDKVLRRSDLEALSVDVERLYGRNTRTRLYYASSQIISGQGGATRNVPNGSASHMETQVKTDVQSDWSSPTTYYVVFNYDENASDTTPPAAAEPSTAAPTDGSFSTEPYP